MATPRAYRKKDNVRHGRPPANYTAEERKALNKISARKCQLRRQGLTIEEFKAKKDKKREQQRETLESKKELSRLKKLYKRGIAALPAITPHTMEKIKNIIDELENAITSSDDDGSDTQ